MTPKPLADLGAGLTTKAPEIDPHPAGPAQHGTPGQVERAFTAASTFFSGMLAISASQFLGAPLKAIDPKFYESYMAFTKQSFGVLITTMTQWWSPTVVKVSGDRSLPRQLFHRQDGTLECRFPKRLVMMANHQLYTDWLYLWWVAYTNNMHGYIYIILKESLKNVPIVGWGAQFYNFIFLSRKWEQDKKQFQAHLDQLSKAEDPMWLLIFPEGTNLAKGTRERSKAWADKNGLQDMKHQLLPRSRGLQFSLQRLSKTTDWLYDCTIGYEGIPPGEFGQDIFTLRSSMFEGRPPKSVNMHFRRFKISNIPIHDDKAFDVWLRNRWREKDYLLEHFSRFNSFPTDIDWMSTQTRAGRKDFVPQPAKCIETQIKSNNLEEFLSIFAPLTSVLMVLFLFYGGTNPDEIMNMLGDVGKGKGSLNLVRDDSSKDNPLRLQNSKGANVANGVSLAEIDKMTPAAVQKDMIQKYLNSIRPAAADAIALPDQALRKVHLTAKAPKKPAPSVKSQPIPGRKLVLAKTNQAGKQPSIVSAPPAKLAPRSTKQQQPVPPVPRIRRTSLDRTIHPGSSVSKANTISKAATPQVKPVKAISRPVPAATKPKRPPPKNTTAQGKSKETGTENKQVTIDPRILARMKGVPAAFSKGGVTIDPKVLSRMKSNQTTKVVPGKKGPVASHSSNLPRGQATKK